MKVQEKITLTNKIADAIQRSNDTMGYISEAGTYKFLLPTPKTSGSTTDQRAFAVSMALDIVSQHEKYLVD